MHCAIVVESPDYCNAENEAKKWNSCFKKQFTIVSGISWGKNGVLPQNLHNKLLKKTVLSTVAYLNNKSMLVNILLSTFLS